jgi:predicted nucleotidyltransferase
MRRWRRKNAAGGGSEAKRRNFLAFVNVTAYITVMSVRGTSVVEALRRLRLHEAALRTSGVEALTLFGSMARDEAATGSDIDLAMRAGAGFSVGGFDHFGRMDALRQLLSALLGCEVDLVEENAVRPRLRQVIEQEGIRAF